MIDVGAILKLMIVIDLLFVLSCTKQKGVTNCGIIIIIIISGQIWQFQSLWTKAQPNMNSEQADRIRNSRQNQACKSSNSSITRLNGQDNTRGNSTLLGTVKHSREGRTGRFEYTRRGDEKIRHRWHPWRLSGQTDRGRLEVNLKQLGSTDRSSQRGGKKKKIQKW